MDLYSVLDFIESENIPASDKFMQRTMLAALTWLKDEFAGRNVDDIDYSELVKVLQAMRPGILEVIE